MINNYLRFKKKPPNISKGIAMGTARPTALSIFGAKIETREAQTQKF